MSWVCYYVDVRYGLNIVVYPGHSVKDAMNKLKVDHPEILGIYLGTRRTDPYCGLV